jgi:hypothetical protein
MKLPTIGWNEVVFVACVMATLLVTAGWFFVLYSAFHFAVNW